MRQRMHVLLISITSVFIILILLSLYIMFISHTMELAEQHGIEDIARIEQEIQAAGEAPDYQLIARSYAEGRNIHIVIVALDFTLLADSNRNGVISGKYINADLSAAKDRSVSSSIVRNRTFRTLDFSVGEVINTGNGSIIISCMYDLPTVTRVTTLYIVLAGGILLLIILLVILLTKYFLRQYRKPIHNLLQHTRKAAATRGGYTKIQVESTNPELLQLAREFNTLIDTYDLLIASDNEKYSEINSLLSHIRTGIMIVGLDNHVSLINPRAEELLQVDKAHLFTKRSGLPGKSRDLRKVLDFAKLVNDDKLTRNEVIDASGGQILELSIEAMYSKYRPYSHSGTLVLIRDITDIRRLERLKDEFVSNVSHELRTPLTVINGFVQTLQSWDILNADDRMKSLTIIELETERLKKLVSELLMLSRIEGEMDRAGLETFEAASLLDETIVSLRPIAGEKRIKLNSSCTERTRCLLTGREIWFKQIAVNLIDNAIKYSHPETAVSIILERLDDMVLLSVSDQGIGIPEEDIPRIFERFYRVEKSRNSRIAGSGLGLAITKMMVEEFNGEITVASRQAQGTTVKVRFPAAVDQQSSSR